MNWPAWASSAWPSGAARPIFWTRGAGRHRCGHAGETIVGPGLGRCAGLGQRRPSPLTPEFPLVTLVSMIAPSPDWFIGVDKLDLSRRGGGWAEGDRRRGFRLDAGTDSGPNYTSGDQATVLPYPSSRSPAPPSPPGVPIGTLTFTRTYVSVVPEAPSFQVRAFPTPSTRGRPSPGTCRSPATCGWKSTTFRGRLVRRLRNELTSAGPGRVTWNGQDETGNQAGSGLYFASLVTETGSLTKKLTLVQ